MVISGRLIVHAPVQGGGGELSGVSLTRPFIGHKAALVQSLTGVLEAGAAEETRAAAVRCLGNLLALAAGISNDDDDSTTPTDAAAAPLLDTAEAEVALVQLSKTAVNMCARPAAAGGAAAAVETTATVYHLQPAHPTGAFPYNP